MTRRILLLAMALEMGGAETHVITLARGLKEAGQEVKVMSAGGSLVRFLAEAGIPHEEAPLHRRSPLLMARGVLQVARTLRTWQPHVIHAHARLPAWVAAQARKGTGIPLVITYHGLYRHTGFWRYVNTWGDAVVAISPEVRRHLVDHLGAPAERIHVVPNGVDTGHFRPPKEEPEGLHIVHVSRLDETIAPALSLVEAVRELRPHFPDLRATIAGDGRQRGVVEAAARGVVAMAGAVADPLPLLQEAFAVVGAGRAVLEAMACGRPVIVAGQGGLGGILSPDNWRALSETNFSGRGSGRPLTGKALAEELRPLLSDRERARRLGLENRRIVEEHFSRQKMLSDLLALYERLWSGKNG
ncbi:MAG: glycosyltransferase family 4 protein [Clostridiales bacterium]|nr:glycosyltransferase family 4 protein [Clostridiales bacterium]